MGINTYALYQWGAGKILYNQWLLFETLIKKISDEYR